MRKDYTTSTPNQQFVRLKTSIRDCWTANITRLAFPNCYVDTVGIYLSQIFTKKFFVVGRNK